MSATYDSGLRSNIDWVRLLIADKDVNKPILQDEEIQAILDENSSNRYLAAAFAGELIIAKTRGMVSKQVGDLSINYGGGAVDKYRSYLDGLRLRGITQTKSVLRVL